jgi:hypothetical protein
VPPPRNRLVRALVYFGIALVALEVLYVIAGNVALAVCAKRFDANSPVGLSFERGFTWIPGRASLRGVRVHGGTASDGWSVVGSASVAFAPWSVVTSPRRIDSITMDATQVDIGARRSKGAMQITLSDIVIDDALLSFKADANVMDSTLESSGALLAKGMHGTITLDVAPVDVDKHSIVDTMSGKVALDGVFLSLEPLASFGTLKTTQDEGTLHIAGTLDKGQLKPASEIRAHTAHATLKDDHGSSGAFPKGIDVVVRVAPTTASDLQLAIETPSLVFAGADPSKPADVFDDFTMSVPAGSSDLKLDHSDMRDLDWTSKHATVHEGATTLSAALTGHLHFDVGKDGALVASGGEMHATNVTVLNADAPDHEPFEAKLGITRLAITHENGITLRGPLHCNGGDARPVVEVLVTSDSIRHAVSGSIAHKPFTLDATINRDDARLALDNFVLNAAGLKLRGGYVRKDQSSHGAFILEDGTLPVGIALHDKKESIVLGASSAWLEQQLAK